MVRYKNRYLLLKWKFSCKKVGNKILKGESSRGLLGFFKGTIQSYHGDYGVACVQHSLSVKYHNVETLVSIVRCPRAHCRAVWSALCGITSYKSEPCLLTLLHLAGTIKSSQRALVQHDTAILKEELSLSKNQEKEKQIREILKRDLLPIRL